MRILRIFLLLLTFSPLLPAQQRMLTMEEAVIKQKTTLAADKLKEVYWFKGSEGFAFTRLHQKDSLFSCSAPSWETKLLLTLRMLNTSLRDAHLDTLSALPLKLMIHSVSGELSFKISGNKILFNTSSHKITAQGIARLPVSSENTEDSPGTGFTAYTIGNNLFVSNEKELLTVTHDSNKNIVNGQSVHRDEFGISKGTFWSPKGNLLAFYRMDQTMVTDYPVLDLTQRPAVANLVKYPMAGDKSHEVTVGVFDPVKKTTVFLKTGEPKEQYLTNIAWSPDEKHVYIAVLNRAQKHLWLNAYNAATGEFEKTLFEETSEKYVQPLHPMEFVRDHPSQFVWQSKRNGSNNLYLYDITGKLLRQLTGTDEVDLEVTELNGFDAKGERTIYQCVPKNNLIGRIIRSSSLSDGTSHTCSATEGTHSARLSPDGTSYIDTYSSIAAPPVVAVMNQEGKTLKTVMNASNPLQEFKLGKIRVFTLKTSDGTPLFCRMILPVDFDSTKKYPVIDYLYGGPGVQLITDSWIAGSDLWFQYMAEHGYIVFTLENRGSSGRGLAFEQATFRQLGTVEMEDQLTGVDFLKSKSYVDQQRLGVFGWSFGGFMTTSLMTRHAGVFKTAVAGGPVIDWSYYEVMYTERYMETPQINKQGYETNNLCHYAGNLKGKLLMIHGTSDDVVVWQHSLLFLKSCVDAGTEPDYFVYPGHFHNVLGKDRVHLFTKITDYFTQNL
jgi:dipeptidyl-peptidase-4